MIVAAQRGGGRCRGRGRRHTGRMNAADWIAVALVALAALSGLRRGLVTGVLSLAGLVVGAILGARLAPGVVGDDSPYVPLVALGGAAAGAMLGQSVGGMIGGTARRSLAVVPPLRALDSAGGVVLGIATGLAVCWAVGAVLLYCPGQNDLRRLAQESLVVSTLTEALPPERVMDAVGRIDPFAAIVGPRAGVPRPSPRSRATRRCARPAAPSSGSAASPAGSGSRARAGSSGRASWSRTRTSWPGSTRPSSTGGTGAAGRPRRLVRRAQRRRDPPRPGAAGPRARPRRSRARAARRPARLPGERAVSRDAGAHGAGREGQRARRIRADAGQTADRRAPRRRRSGNSGGPVVDEEGRVVATVFAQRPASDDGFAVPNEQVARRSRTPGLRSDGRVER